MRHEFGGAEQLKEELRGIQFRESLARWGRDLKYTLRGLRKTPGFSALAMIILALGIGSNLAVFSLIDSLFLKPLPVERPAELVQLHALDRSGRQTTLVSTMLDDLRKEPSLRGVCGYINPRVPVDHQGTLGSASALAMTGDCFATLGLRSQLGRPFDLRDDRPGAPAVALLTDSYWRSTFAGSFDVLGKTMQVKGVAFTIVGVVEPRFTGFQLGPANDLILPLSQLPLDFVPVPNRRVYFYVNTLARRAPGVSERQLQARLSVIEKQLLVASLPARFNEAQAREYLTRKLLVGRAEPGANSHFRARFGQPMYVVMGICGAVLLIASVNLAGMLLARGLGRQREMSVRLALGASRWSVARLLALQSIVLAGAGALLGLVFAMWARQVVIAAAGEFFHVSRNLAVDGYTAWFLAAMVVAVLVTLGALPAWQAARFRMGVARSDSGRGVVGSGTGKQKVLLAFQVALTLALVAGGGVFTASSKHLEDMNLGLRTGGVAEAMLAPTAGGYAAAPADAYYRDLLQQVEALPEVALAGLADFAPFWTGLRPDPISTLETVPLAQDVHAQCVAVSERFFETLGVPLVAGAPFRRDDSEPAVIVSQSVAKLFGEGGPIGRHIRVGDGAAYQRLKVVGIAGNVQISLEHPEDTSPLAVYVNLWQHPERQRYPVLLVKSAGAAPIAPAVLRQVVQSRGREYVEHYRTLDDAKGEALVENRLLAWLSAVFGALALILAATGLFALLSYHVASRTNEIGLRMALGAERAEIHSLILRQLAPVLAAGTLAGLGLTFISGRIIAGLVYGVSVYDPRLLLLSIGALAATAALASWIPARRAASVDPLVALRHE